MTVIVQGSGQSSGQSSGQGADRSAVEPALIALGRRPGVGPRTDELWLLPGFCWNARVTTSFGDMPVQGLRLRDPLRGPQGDITPVAWVDEVHLDEDFLHYYPDSRPVVIRAGALGPGRPKADLTVSPAQRINVSPTPFGQDLRPARDLTGRPGVQRAASTGLTYYLFHCGRPTTVLVEGIALPVQP